MKRLLTLALQYYKTLLLYNVAFTVVAITIFAFDAHGITPVSFFFDKAIGFAAAIGLYHYSSRNSYFYYRNAGYNMWRIGVTAILVDIMVYLLIVLTVYLIHVCLA